MSSFIECPSESLRIATLKFHKLLMLKVIINDSWVILLEIVGDYNLFLSSNTIMRKNAYLEMCQNEMDRICEYMNVNQIHTELFDWKLDERN